jgi:hypothetical protein
MMCSRCPYQLRAVLKNQSHPARVMEQAVNTRRFNRTVVTVRHPNNEVDGNLSNSSQVEPPDVENGNPHSILTESEDTDTEHQVHIAVPVTLKLTQDQVFFMAAELLLLEHDFQAIKQEATGLIHPKLEKRL